MSKTWQELELEYKQLEGVTFCALHTLLEQCEAKGDGEHGTWRQYVDAAAVKARAAMAVSDAARRAYSGALTRAAEQVRKTRAGG